MPGLPYAVQRERVATAARRLAAEGLVLGSSGNVSLRHGDAVLVTPAGAALADLEAVDVAQVDLAGELAPGSRAPTSELALHLGAMKRHGAGAVVHTHSPMATAVSCVHETLPVVHYNMLLLGGEIRVAPYHTFGTAELAAAVLDALEDRRAALMGSHGAVVQADGVEEAVELALLLEWCCQVYVHASAVGEPRVLDEAEQQSARAELHPAG